MRKLNPAEYAKFKFFNGCAEKGRSIRGFVINRIIIIAPFRTGENPESRRCCAVSNGRNGRLLLVPTTNLKKQF